jgi:5-methylcytosine-specific restriction protein A
MTCVKRGPIPKIRAAISCQKCGQLFVQKDRHQAAPPKYCSRSCATSASRRERACLQCGVKFWPGTSKANRCCSLQCLKARQHADRVHLRTDPEVRKLRWRAQDAARPHSAGRGYGGAWRRLRLEILAEEPRCRACGAESTEVDHILPMRLGGSTDRANLQALCKPCHSAKTMRESGPNQPAVEELL